MFLFKLIGIPFLMLGSLLSLVGITSAILLTPLKFVVRNPLLTLALIAGLIVYLASSDTNNRNALRPIPVDKQAKEPPKGQPPVIQAIEKYEDGNSVFATDVYQTMADSERAQYSRVFYGVMSRVPDGKSHVWTYYNIHGSLTPTETFKNNTGEVCRKFTEVLKVHTIQQTISGTACDNGGGTWCKLRVNATPACGLGGKNPSMLDGLSMPRMPNALRNLF